MAGMVACTEVVRSLRASALELRGAVGVRHGRRGDPIIRRGELVHQPQHRRHTRLIGALSIQIRVRFAIGEALLVNSDGHNIPGACRPAISEEVVAIVNEEAAR